MTSTWSLPGANGETILGACHEPVAAPAGVVLVAHGFKGYKDYGMIPRIAQTIADAGFVAHRFNFSHSGVTNDHERFERPELFERGTWNRQVEDLHAIVDAIGRGRLAGARVPMVLAGHSRGGTACLLAAGRDAAAGRPGPAGVATFAAPATCNSLAPADEAALERLGFIESPSARTGEMLRVGRAFLDEQRADPEAHDVLALASRIACPVLLVHGADDETVPSAAAHRLAEAIGERCTVRIVEGGDHVFNTCNPLPPDEPSSPALSALLDALVPFVRRACAA